MGRHKQPEIREQLLEACTGYALRQGLPNRLAPLAAAAGTSPRMLLYHFATKEGLQREILHRARARQRQGFEELLRARSDEPYLTTLGKAWTAITTSTGRLYLEMFGRLREDAEQRLWPGFRLEATTDWLGPLEQGLSSLGRPELATVVLAVIRGLIMDLEATADTSRVNEAFNHFVRAIQAESAPSTAV